MKKLSNEPLPKAWLILVINGFKASNALFPACDKLVVILEPKLSNWALADWLYCTSISSVKPFLLSKVSNCIKKSPISLLAFNISMSALPNPNLSFNDVPSPLIISLSANPAPWSPCVGSISASLSDKFAKLSRVSVFFVNCIKFLAFCTKSSNENTLSLAFFCKLSK